MYNKTTGTWDSDIDWERGELQTSSPTADGETLGQSQKRVANDLFTEAATAGVGGPNLAVIMEARDLIEYDPDSKHKFNLAVKAGFTERAAHEDPLSAIMRLINNETGEFEPRASTPGDANPRYRQYAGVTDPQKLDEVDQEVLSEVADGSVNTIG